jgi:hypothetical protein
VTNLQLFLLQVPTEQIHVTEVVVLGRNMHHVVATVVPQANGAVQDDAGI